jgi:hypothetical protein
LACHAQAAQAQRHARREAGGAIGLLKGPAEKNIWQGPACFDRRGAGIREVKGGCHEQARFFTGVGALLLNGALIAKVHYEIMVNGDETGLRLAFGSMQVSDQAIKVMEQSSGNYTLSLEKSGVVELVFTEVVGNTINFDVSGPVPGF